MQTPRLVYYTNQFFSGMGGESAAAQPLRFAAEPLGPGRLLTGRCDYAGTLVCGDDHAVEHLDDVAAEVAQTVARSGADLFLAGPAFNAGRFGVACARVASEVQRRLGLPSVTGMYPENPGVEVAGPAVLIVATGAVAGDMQATLGRMLDLALRLQRREPLGDPEVEGFLARGVRRNVFVDEIGAERAVRMLLSKLRGEPFVTELPLPDVAGVRIAPGCAALGRAKLAVVTTSGVVPAGNPDGIESRRATHWASYPLGPGRELPAAEYACVHGGYDNHYVAEDPLRAVPLDALRQLESEGAFGSLLPRFYTTVGAGAPVARAREFGRQIAADLRRQEVDAVLLTCT